MTACAHSEKKYCSPASFSECSALFAPVATIVAHRVDGMMACAQQPDLMTKCEMPPLIQSTLYFYSEDFILSVC